MSTDNDTDATVSEESQAHEIKEGPQENTVEPTVDNAEDSFDSQLEKANLNDYTSDLLFAHFPISSHLLQGIQEKGFQVATRVQAATVEHALLGKDLLVRSKTGTGKTAAFAIPILERVQPGKVRPQALVLAPTRELAIQIGNEFSELGAYCDVRLLLAYGGTSIDEQLTALKDGIDIIVGTPGRILDLIRRKALDCSELAMLCLDEADEMLSMGFYEDVHSVISAAPSDRQMYLFSATLGDQVKQLIQAFELNALDIQLSTDADQVENLTHVIYETSPSQHKVRSLLGVFIQENPKSAIIFCNTREDVSMVASFLSLQGLDVEKISGELPQRKREKVMRNVRGGRIQVLVATDIASRGIDISHLTHVINYSLPEDPAVYLHRSGRTGRIGKKGISISLVGAREMNTRRILETTHKINFEQRIIPSPEELLDLRVQQYVSAIHETMTMSAFDSYLPTAKALLERDDKEALVAALLRGFFIWHRQRAAELSEEQGRLESREQKGRSGRRRYNNKSQSESGKGNRNNRNRNQKRNRNRGNRGNRGSSGNKS